MEHAVSSLLQIFSFSHRACDAILQARGVDIVNAYDTHKRFDGVYIGLAVIIAWEASVVAIGLRAWRKKAMGTSERLALVIFPLFAALGLLCLYAQLTGMVAYVDTCRRVLT